MLAFTDKLFLVYKTRRTLRNCAEIRRHKTWMDYTDKMDLRHSGKKMTFILRANKLLLDKYDGDVPKERDELEVMNGVGKTRCKHHNGLVLSAIVGIDVHVKRI